MELLNKSFIGKDKLGFEALSTKGKIISHLEILVREDDLLILFNELDQGNLALNKCELLSNTCSGSGMET